MCKKTNELIKPNSQIGIDSESRAYRGLLVSTPTGHNLSQGDLESEADSDNNPANTGQGCYMNYDHFPHQRKSNSPSKVNIIEINI